MLDHNSGDHQEHKEHGSPEHGSRDHGSKEHGSREHSLRRHRLVILGTGPAGLTAALYAARANLEPLVIDGRQPGGQLTITTEVENYPGFPHGIMGPELMDHFRAQAERFGTLFEQGTVTKVDFAHCPFRLTIEDGEDLAADTLIIATGASAKLLGLPTESALMGYGVSACATCDGFFFRDKEVAVVGGGDTAMEEANFLTKFASKVTLIHRREEFRASKIMLERARRNEKIAWLPNTRVKEVMGMKEKKVCGLILEDARSGRSWQFPVDGLFIGIGHEPNTAAFRGHLAMDPVGYIQVEHPSTRTSVNGVFACGDAADPIYRQAVTAAGTGCRAAIDAERFLEAQGH